jgi:cell division septation protein DedD
VERSATHDTEYVDIVLGYRHILLFSLVFGVLIFSTGYFAGYQRGQSVEAASAATSPTRTPQQSPPASLPPVKVPALLTEPLTTESGDVVKEMEDLTQESLTPGAVAEPSETAAPPTSQPDAEAAAPAAEPREEEKPPATPAREPEKPKKLAPQAQASPPHQSGAVYLQVSSFSAPQEAEKLIDDLAAEGFRALIDGQLIGGKHTVLVGPFPDFKTAADRAKDLRRQRREAFPIRR